MALSNIMSGMGGIGQQAADLRDSNTPQQLQQGYEKSVKDGTPSLSYLMAINSLADEVERRKRDIDAKMEPKEPGTILEQRAKKLKDLTVGQNTSEKAEQVGGIAQLQQQKQQQNMQRMAQGAQGAPQGPQMAPQMAPQAPPRMAANGGIIMQGAPNMQRMAGGGIIGFASRGYVDPFAEERGSEVTGDFGPYTDPIITQEMVDAYRKRLARTNSRAAVSASDDELRARLVDNPKLAKPFSFPNISIRKADDRYSPEEKRQKQYQEAAGADYDRMQVERLMNLPRTEIQQPLPVSTGGPPAVTTGGPSAVTTGGPSAVTTGGLPAVTTGGPLTLSNQPITQGPGPARIARKEVPPVRLPPTVIGANTAKYPDQRAGLATMQAAYDKENRDRIAALPSPTDQRDDAADFSNRGGVQEQYAAMLARRQALAEKQAAERADSSFLRRTSGMGSGPVLKEYGASAVRDMDDTARLDRNALTRQEAIRTGGIAADRGIAGKALDVQRTTTASNAQLTAQVMKARQQSITNQGRDLNAAEQRALAARVANMTAAQKQQELASNEYINRLDNASKEKISAARNKIMSTTNDLAREANSLKGQKDRNDLKAKYAIAIANVKKTKEKLVADMVTARSVELMGKKATPASKKLIMAQVRKDVDSSLNAAIKALQDELSRLNLKVVPTGKPTNGKQ